MKYWHLRDVDQLLGLVWVEGVERGILEEFRDTRNMYRAKFQLIRECKLEQDRSDSILRGDSQGLKVDEWISIRSDVMVPIS